jgi:flavin-dependent dehydrogenase
MKPTAENEFDVAIIGGALAGASAALLLQRDQPGIRVVIIEKSTQFTRRVGEATTEITGWFLCRGLGLTKYLNEAHISKQGMRFWCANDQTHSVADCSEIGGKYLVRVPAFQVDRAALDSEVFRQAVELGAQVRRPAQVQNVELVPGGQQILTIRHQEQTETIRARWVIDASGVAAVLARKNGWWRANAEHPTTAVWARWRGVTDWDGPELAAKHPQWAADCFGIRGTATNHFVGDGWWAWCIPLKGGDTSVGVVFDQRLVQFPEEGSLPQRLKDFLCQHPTGRSIMANAEWIETDVHWRKNLPYSSTVFAGDGFVLTGDARAFLDPFYSPGMDWLSYTTISAVELILAQRRGEAMAPLVDMHNETFVKSYRRWFLAVYKDKYEYMGDFDFMRLAFLLDLGLYYLGVISQPFKRGRIAMKEPIFSTPPSVPFFHLMRTYNRRFAAMARERRRRGEWGKHNAGRKLMFGGYTFSGSSAWPIVKALATWIGLEITEGWRTWFRKSETRASHSAGMAEPMMPSPVAESAAVATK